ncbi:hypothetical protein [Thalassolituus oleivorans]|jgi:hypothetical protein|uniref:Lipoprotein n=2 Tax=root TaxID=1 RepID=M5E3P2_9GAMM|nr:hypothetical protein [Thalassolituus oleivorans]CCU72129.1 hypothetical protein TOL_1705 [Thalassolituus oleivorans MIL-1]
MKNKMLLSSVVLVVIIALGACSSQTYHKALMKGQIVDVEDGKIMMCIGSREGASEGDEFRVVRSTFRKDVVEDGESDYELVEVGTVKILTILNEHYATAKVLDGDVKIYDIAEK